MLHFKIFFHLCRCVTVRFRTRKHIRPASQNGHDIRIRLCVLTDEVQLSVYMGHKIFQGLVKFAFGIAALDLDMLSIHIELGCFDCFLQFLGGGQFKFSCLLLVVTDNVLHGFRKLCHITLFHIFTDLHRIFQRLIIRCIGKHNNCLPGGFRHQPEFSFFHSIRGHGKDTQTHSAGSRADGHGIDHLVKGKVVLAISVFPGSVDIAENHVADAFHDRRGIHGCISINLALDILLLVREEVIDFTRASDIVLTHQSVKTAAHLLTHDDLIQADIISHKDHNVIKVRFHIIDIAHEIEELQYIHILRLDPVSVCGCTFAALDHTADGAVQEGMYRIVEEIKRRKGILVLIFNFLGRLLEPGKHGTLAAGEMLA